LKNEKYYVAIFLFKIFILMEQPSSSIFCRFDIDKKIYKYLLLLLTLTTSVSVWGKGRIWRVMDQAEITNPIITKNKSLNHLVALDWTNCSKNPKK
jgi:hypothetical protein